MRTRALGVDIGGTKIAVAAVDAAGAIAARVTIATEAELGFERAVGRIVESAGAVLAEAGWTLGELCGAGVGCTGPVSAERGVIDNPYTLGGWQDCDIVSALGGALKLPVRLENDADAAALGECFGGAGRGFRQVVMLTLGTGVGGGAVIDGQVYRGTRGEHPELGHIPIDPAGPECYCGTRGCLEAIASGTAIAAAGREAGYATSRDVFAAAAQGQPPARAIVERAAGCHGDGRLDHRPYVHARANRAGRGHRRRALRAVWPGGRASVGAGHDGAIRRHKRGASRVGKRCGAGRGREPGVARLDSLMRASNCRPSTTAIR